jgi:hypothetical protein
MTKPFGPTPIGSANLQYEGGTRVAISRIVPLRPRIASLGVFSPLTSLALHSHEDVMVRLHGSVGCHLWFL